MWPPNTRKEGALDKWVSIWKDVMESPIFCIVLMRPSQPVSHLLSSWYQIERSRMTLEEGEVGVHLLFMNTSLTWWCRAASAWGCVWIASWECGVPTNVRSPQSASVCTLNTRLLQPPPRPYWDSCNAQLCQGFLSHFFPCERRLEEGRWGRMRPWSGLLMKREMKMGSKDREKDGERMWASTLTGGSYSEKLFCL